MLTEASQIANTTGYRQPQHAKHAKLAQAPRHNRLSTQVAAERVRVRAAAAEAADAGAVAVAAEKGDQAKQAHLQHASTAPSEEGL